MVKTVARINKKPRKVRVKIVSIVVCALMLVASAFFLWRIVGEAKTTVSLVSDITSAKQELTALQAENDQLTAQIEKLQNSDYVQSYARSQYLITKQGEQIFQLPAQDGSSSGSTGSGSDTTSGQ